MGTLHTEEVETPRVRRSKTEKEDGYVTPSEFRSTWGFKGEEGHRRTTRADVQ